jgi:DNA-directed RNA polymerase subunit beta'
MEKPLKQEIDRAGIQRMVVIEHKGDLHPQIIIVDDKNNYLAVYGLPDRAHVVVKEGQNIHAGDLLAKTPREIGKTQDITGGLPRVTEIFEARKPKDPAIMSEIDGIVEVGEKRRGKRSIIVKSESGIDKEHFVPQGKEMKVQRGDRVRAGDPLVDGPLVPHDILRISGEEALQQYLLQEVQNVYRSQNVTIDDKHIEIIIAQMLKKVKIDSPGNTDFLPGSVVDKFKVRQSNEQVIKEGGQAADYKPLLLGITKASLQSDSFISAASFQETTKVLTEAALAG